ncbi:MAG: hypothetical protein II379_02115, partial [Oscillospiraceae bacterium]|nr:hypothetical protein [Oscillospiraceae bacterium]
FFAARQGRRLFPVGHARKLHRLATIVSQTCNGGNRLVGILQHECIVLAHRVCLCPDNLAAEEVERIPRRC